MDHISNPVKDGCYSMLVSAAPTKSENFSKAISYQVFKGEDQSANSQEITCEGSFNEIK